MGNGEIYKKMDIMLLFFFFFQWGLVCGELIKVDIFQFFMIVGQGLGGFLFIGFFDKFGRKIVYVSLYIFFFVLCFVIVFIFFYIGFVIFRFFIGMVVEVSLCLLSRNYYMQL